MSNLNGVAEKPAANSVKSAFVGAIFGVDAAGHCLALATVFFSGALAAGLGTATAIFLFGSALATTILYFYGGFRQSMAISQDATVSILAPAVLLATASVTLSGEARVATALAVIGVSAFASGLAFWAIGRLGLGRKVRMFPFPVMAGFLASSGYLLVYVALMILTERSGVAMFAALTYPAVLLRLVPAVVMAAALMATIKFMSGPTPILTVIVVALAGYYAVTLALGVDTLRAAELGLLPVPNQFESQSLSPAMLTMVDWRAVLHSAPTIGAVVLLNLIAVLLNTTGLDLATQEDVDENRELRVTGLTNMLIGCFGGQTSYIQSGANILASKLKVERSAMAFGHVATLLVACGLAPLMVAYVPTFIPAGLLLFIGASMLDDWLVATRRRLIPVDWLIVLAIVVASAVLGILAAIAIGLLLALMGFAYASLRMPVIRHVTTAAGRRSILDRSALDNKTLQSEGHRIRILHLQGPLFFGSVDRMIITLQGLTRTVPGMRAIIIDFSEVYSFDSSACAALDKLLKLMTAEDVMLHVTGISGGLRAVFNRWGVPLADGENRGFRHWDSLDLALEYCETHLLAELRPEAPTLDIARVLFELGRQNPRTADLIGRMHRRTLQAGERLIAAADLSYDVYFLLSGRLAVLLPVANGPALRVRSMTEGAIVGESAWLSGQPRNADVICEEAAEVLCLAAKTIDDIQVNDRDLAALLLEIFGRSLAAKVAQTNGLLSYSLTSRQLNGART